MTVRHADWSAAWAAAVFAALMLPLSACSKSGAAAETEEHEEHGAHAEETPRGPHDGRLLEADGLDLEVTIYEAGTEPRFRIYPFDGDEPVAPSRVEVSVALTRLGGHVDPFTFTPQADYLVSDGVVREPHSFDVTVEARFDGRDYDWIYESYEGRTEIAQAAADAAGVEVTVAGPATLLETIELTGLIALRPEARAEVRARYRGAVLEARKTVGDAVAAGDLLARVEAADSLQTYEIAAPIDGVILERATNVGDVAGDAPLYVIADLSRLQAEFHVFPRDVARVNAGQPVRIESLDGVAGAETTIASFLPTAEADTQTLLARAFIDNTEGAFRPGMTVRGVVTIGEREAAVAVDVDALQRWRDFDAVFTRIGETYEVRPVLLGARAGGWVEVLDGLDVGDAYVSENSFLIRADIEKAGASHDH